MTNGSIVKHLLLFAMPLLIGNAFQQLYHTVDSVVVGNFVGKEALAAVGGVGPIINMLIGFFSGLAAGAGIVISQCFGTHDQEKLHYAVQTTMALTLTLCVVLTAAGLLLTPSLVRLINAPADVEALAASYLRIYFAGLTGLLIYNMGAGILRAVGDSRRPLCFLILSALTNTVLDILFVGGMGMGIAGAALATVVSQGLSALLILAVLTWERSGCRLDWREIRINRQILRRICSIGLPTAVQNAILSFSNVFVQSYINRFGSACMAAWASYGKIEAVALLPSSALATANTVFGGQNLGAEKTDRAHAGTRCALRLGLGVTALILTPILLFAPRLIGLFNRDVEVLRYGTQLVRLMAPFYLVSVADQIYRSALNGAGLTRFTMLATLGGYVLSRQAYLLLARKQFDNFFAIILGYPLGWTVCCGTLIYGYCRIRKSMRKPRLAS